MSRNYPDTSNCLSALMLFGAAFGGRNDCCFVRADGVPEVTVVDTDRPAMIRMRDEGLYPFDWRYVDQDAFYFTSASIQRGRTYDLVSLDPFTGAAMEACHDLGWHHFARIANKMIVMGAEPERIPPPTVEVIPRSDIAVWWVIRL